MRLSDKAVLVVIDAQRAFEAWEARGRHRNKPRAVERIATLLEAFRAVHRPIIHIRHANRAEGSDFHPDGALFAPIEMAREQPGEAVIVKAVNSAFIGTDLEQRLRDAGIKQVLICGATTNHCVETTTRMAGNLGFDAVLVEDACWTFDRVGPDGTPHRAEDIHAMSLSNLNEEFAEIVESAVVVAAVRAGGRRAD